MTSKNDSQEPILAQHVFWLWLVGRGNRPTRKLRPIVLLEDVTEYTKTVFAVVCSHSSALEDPPRPFCVPMPWNPNREQRAIFRKKTVAVGDWVVEIDVDILWTETESHKPPRLPAKYFDKILDEVLRAESLNSQGLLRVMKLESGR